MNLWILTIGSSDIQLDSNSKSQEKGKSTQNYSDKIWNYWYTDELKAEYNLPASAVPTRSFVDKDETYRVAPRVLGTVYKASPERVQQEILTYLTFPLLDNFVSTLKNMNAEDAEKYPLPAAIVILLTDQSAILQDSQQRRKLKSPHWQDTCELEPILRHYMAQKFPGVPCETVLLNPIEVGKGLDNWDAVLSLVGGKFQDLCINGTKIEVSPEEKVYVSHQAGTPAISSAVQFMSLAQFGDRVRFLVSNEYNPELTGFVESSSYLLGIKREQAKKLLENHDYAGVDKLVREYLSEDAKILLAAALQWNYAEFGEFSKLLKKQGISEKYPDLAKDVETRTEEKNWWWTAYEAAYLGIVRLKQGNTVEAMFHSFRAVEGLLRRWVDEFYPQEIKQTKHPKWEENERWNRNLNTYGEDLYWFLTLKKEVDQTKDIKQNKTPDIFIFGSRIFKKRNDLFHQLKGLQGKNEVFENWRSPNEPQWRQDPEEKWKIRVLKCLNFISDETFEFLDKEGSDGRVASLMVEVHQELVSAIADL